VILRISTIDVDMNTASAAHSAYVSLHDHKTLTRWRHADVIRPISKPETKTSESFKRGSRHLL
jgi:hypothetical protein